MSRSSWAADFFVFIGYATHTFASKSNLGLHGRGGTVLGVQTVGLKVRRSRSRKIAVAVLLAAIAENLRLRSLA